MMERFIMVLGWQPLEKDIPKGLPFELKDYIELVELTGRCIREDKAGYIDNSQAPILNRLNISPENRLTLTKNYRKCFYGAVGHPEILTEYCQHLELKKRPTLSICQKLLA